MRKKILVTITVLAVIAALAVAFSGAQFESKVASRSNLVTFGNIAATQWYPDPLITMKGLVPGETRAGKVYLYPKGDINQDIYIGLKNEDWQADATFGTLLQFRLSVDGGAWSGWDNLHDGLFTSWRQVKANAASDSTIVVDIEVYVPTTLGSEFMGVNYWFKTLIVAVQTGGTAPTPIPYLYPI